MTSRLQTSVLVSRHTLRRVGSSSIVAVLVFALTVLSGIAVAAWQRLGDEIVADRLAGLAAARLDPTATVTGAPIVLSTPFDDTDPGGWLVVQKRLEDLVAGAEDALRGALGTPEIVDRMDAVAVAGATPAGGAATEFLSVAFSPTAADRMRIVDGRLPDPAPPIHESPELGTVEIVLSVRSAAELEWNLGEARDTMGAILPTRFVLVGVFEAADDTAGYWAHVPSVIDPQIVDDGNTPRVTTLTGFAHPESISPVSYRLTGQRHTATVWLPIAAAGLTAADPGELLGSLRSFLTTAHPLPTSAQPATTLRFDSDLAGELGTALAQRSATTAVLAMLVSGPIGVALAVIALGCRHILFVRRSTLTVLTARGASAHQIRALALLDGLIAGILPAVLGALVVAAVANVTAGGTAFVPAFLPAVVLGLAPVAVLLLTAGRTVSPGARADLGARASRLRVAAEIAVVALAALALWVLLSRGYRSDVDVFLAGAPLLLALVACTLTLRLYPLPVRAVFARLRRGRAATGFVGAARTLRGPSGGLTVVLALVVGVSVTVSSGVLLSVLQNGSVSAARSQVGADLRVSGAMFTSELTGRIAAIDGVATVAGVSDAVTSDISTGAAQRPVSVFVVDGAAVAAAQGERPGLLPPGVRVDTDEVTVVVSGSVADDLDGESTVTVGGVAASVVGVTRGPVPFGSRQNWVVVDRAHAVDVLGVEPSARTLLIGTRAEADAATVAADIEEAVGSHAEVVSAVDVLDRLETAPALIGLRVVLFAAIAVTALLGALAIVMTLVVGTPQRARVAALMRTLGARGGSAATLAFWEAAPPAGAAIVAGTLFGAVIPWVVMTVVDLRPFTGSTVAPGYTWDPLLVGLPLLGFAAVLAVGVGVALLASRRTRAGAALRTIEEG